MSKLATGQDLLDFAVARLGARYVFGAIAPKDDPQYRGPYDCAELPSHGLYQVAGILYGCNQDADPAIADAGTYYWAKDARYRGLIITASEAAAIPGAAVLRVGASGATGHIVISDGQGGTVEAACAKLGVIRGHLAGRRWTMGILVPGIKYATPSICPPTLPPVTVYRLTAPRMQGAIIRQIQICLRTRGFYLGELDGVYGPQTFAAVLAFQRSADLLADGEVGTVTAKALEIAL